MTEFSFLMIFFSIVIVLTGISSGIQRGLNKIEWQLKILNEILSDNEDDENEHNRS